MSVHKMRGLWRALVRARRQVDPEYYLARYPDVARSWMPAALHFALFGAAEGRTPSASRMPMDGPSRPSAIGDASPAYENANRFYADTDPEVSIVVLNLDRADLTWACLDSVWRHTAGHRYEIVVVDNGSAADDVEALTSRVGRFRLLRLPTNRFFGEGNNLGAEIARAPCLLFLNNDTLVTSGWLPPLMRVLRDHPDAGAVGPTLVYPDGRIQEAGASLSRDGTATQRRKGSRDDIPGDIVERVDYCSAAALLVRREAFERVLGFDLIWEPAYYEDVDLCFRLAQQGLFTYYCSGSRVVHLEHATTAQPGHPLQCGNVVEINRAKFVSRWSERLADRSAAAPLTEHEPPAASRSPERRRLGLYTAHALIPGGGERYLLTIAEAAHADFDVTLVTDAPYSRLRVLQLGRELGLDLQHVDRSTRDDLARRPPFDVFLAMDIAILPAVVGCGRRNLFVCQFPFPMTEGVRAERSGHLDRYERLLVYSAFAQRHTNAALLEFPGAVGLPVEVIAPPVDLIDPSHSLREPMILSIGRFYAGGHPKRHDALVEALQAVLAKCPDAQLHLAGALHPEAEHREHFLRLQGAARGLPVTFHVNPSRAALRALCARSSVYWHAAGLGCSPATEPEKMEHFGISVVEAMSAGCVPVCFNGGGPVEIVAPGATGFLFETLAELSDHTLRVLSDPGAAWLRSMRGAAVTSSARYDKQRFRESILRVLQ